MGKFAVAAGSIRYAAMVIGLTLAAIVLFSISVYEIHRDPCGVLLDRDGCLEFFRKKPLYENANLDAGLFYTSSRSEGLKWLRQEGSKVELAPTPLLAAVLEQAPAITIFVHGFRGVDSVDASYFQEMVSGIAGDRRFSGALIIYDWREDYVRRSPFERGYFAKQIDGMPPLTMDFLANQPNPGESLNSSYSSQQPRIALTRILADMRRGNSY